MLTVIYPVAQAVVCPMFQNQLLNQFCFTLFLIV